jgi:hypothetical protein
LPLALPAETELTKIELMDEAKGWVKVGSGVTNEQLRRWCNAADKLTLPLNVIMVEITAGGANGMIWYVFCWSLITHQKLTPHTATAPAVDTTH